MFHSKLKKQVKVLEKTLCDLAEHCGTWVEFHEDGEVLGGMRLSNDGPAVKICDVVRAIVTHLELEIGIKAVEKLRKEK